VTLNFDLRKVSTALLFRENWRHGMDGQTYGVHT